MKTFLSVLLLCLLPSFSAAQLVQNGNFESGTNNWFAVGGTTNLRTVDSENQSKCLEVTQRVEHWNGAAQFILGKLTAGTDYHVKASVKLKNAASGNIRFEIKQEDDRGIRFVTIGEVKANDQDWSVLETGFRYQVNGTATDLVLTISGLPEGGDFDFFIDSVSITENNWRADSDTRIEQIRKRDVQLNFFDADGNDQTDLDVEVQQIGHHFPFGSTLNESVSTNPVYANYFINHFEWATTEWRTQWRVTEINQGVEDYSYSDAAIEFAQSNGIDIRGHAILWANEFFLPTWLNALSDAEVEIETRDRIRNAVSHFKGQFRHWDVNNEMLDFSFFKTRIGEDFRAEAFKQARQYDPDVKLFTNEFGLYRSAQKSADYRDLITGIEAAGGDVNAIGIQSHFFHSNASPKSMEIALDTLKVLNKPIWATEFDVVNPDDNERADCLEAFYRYMFSRPEVNGIIMWGFWEGTHWLGPDASLVDLDWTVNAAGQRYNQLMAEWTTSTQSTLGSNQSTLDFRGFHGRYLVKVTDANTSITNWHLINILPDGNGIPAEISIVTNDVENSLTVYGTHADDAFGMNFSNPGVFTFNGTHQLIPNWEQFTEVRFEGLGGDDSLFMETDDATASSFRTFSDHILDQNSGFDIAFHDIESVTLLSAHPNDFVHFIDSEGDDRFVSHPLVSTMHIDQGAEIQALNFATAIARATRGNDTLEMYDSAGNDGGYSNLFTVRINDPFSVRRADFFEQNFVFSTAGNDRFRYFMPEDTASINIDNGDVAATVSQRSYEFSGFGYSLLNLEAGSTASMNISDSSGNDAIRIRPNLLEYFSPESRIFCRGITAATIDAVTGTDTLILRDGNGDDTLTVDDDVVSIAGTNYNFQTEGFDRAICIGQNAGVNSSSVLNTSLFLRVIGNWVPQLP